MTMEIPEAWMGAVEKTFQHHGDAGARAYHSDVFKSNLTAFLAALRDEGMAREYQPPDDCGAMKNTIFVDGLPCLVLRLDKGE